MSGQIGFARFHRRRLLQAAPFSGRVRSAAAVVCCLLLLQFLWVPLEAAPGRQLRPLKQAAAAQTPAASVVKEFTVAGNGKFVLELTLATPGRVKATADWSGTAGRLALILNGPGMTQYYARRDGASPLTLEFEVTQELFARGTAWRLSVADFEAGTSAQGTVRVELPAGGSATAQAQPPAATGAVQAAGGAAATQAQAAGEKAQAQTGAISERTAARPETKVTVQEEKPIRTGLKGSRGLRKVEPAEIDEDVTPLREFVERRIAEFCGTDELGGMLVPLFFKYFEEVAADPGLLKQYYRASEHNKGYTQADFDHHFRQLIKAYREIPQETKARLFAPGYAQMGRGTRLDLKRLGADVVQKVRPGLGPEVKRLVQSSFSGRFLLQPEKVQPAQQAPVPGRGARPAVKAQARTTAPVERLSAIDGLIGRGAGLRSESGLAELRDALQRSGVELPESAAKSEFARSFFPDPSTFSALPSLNGKTASVDYYRYMITLDWLKCLNKNESSDDEPYFGVITMLPQFDASDTAFFKHLKAGCLDWVSSYTTATYGGVGRGESKGVQGRDRIVFDYLTFNSPASFTVQLWEEDYSKGAVADGIRQAAMDIFRRIQSDLKAALVSQVQSYIADAILSLGGGIDSSAALQLLNQVFTGNLSFADFQSMLFNLYSGRAFDASWYLIYFLFSGGDFLKTLAMIGGGSTVLGAVFLGLAVFGPAIADMFEGFFSGDFAKGLWNLFKIVTVIPLIIDLFKSLFTSLRGFFRSIMAWLDPDDYIGEKTIVIERTTDDWQNDARDGEWNRSNMGWVRADWADDSFKRQGFGPTRDNSSFLWQNNFWVPKINIKRWGDVPRYDWARGMWEMRTEVTCEYDIYYEVKREVAGGRTTIGYWFPSTPRLNSKIIPYKSKSSPDAWWTNIIRVTVMSATTDKAPWAVLVNEKTRQSFYSLSGPSFEFEAMPGADYTLYLTKLTEGEMAGYVSIYEGPVIDVKCPPTGSSVRGSSGGGGGGNPPGSGRARVNK